MARLEASLVSLIWHDAHAETEWTSLEDIDPEPYDVHSVGWLLPDAKPGHVVICQSLGRDDGLDGVLSIPVGMVVKLTTLGNPPHPNTDSLES
jgi:hypothetical protein